ncbi:aminoglycoside phosphotransferase family protein [Aspergillus candidus]|uniref:Protein kinase-like protein n=1 Tax=Aspergillus candidus TaxID=41067 RepID=A0A2I2EZD4_ASPCN|nr:protein kinase-like protein [Aspergillus candidus]PLB33735.1 protein kinase-like protein [Aspergillus candidus]
MALYKNNSHMVEPPSPLPYTIQNLHTGQNYIRDGTTIIPCQSTIDPLSLPPGQEVTKVLYKQINRLVLQLDISWETKELSGVLPTEAEAMRLVFNNTGVPVPEVLFASFHLVNEIADTQQCDKRDSTPRWSNRDDHHDIAKLSIRTIPRPQNDTDVRVRIYKRYLHFGGLRYKDQLPDMLPLSERSVFTHADIAPRNVMVDEENRVTGLLDWEWAGWYPDYWEYAQIMRPAFKGDCSEWMERTAPQRWDLRGIYAARKVLF